MAFRQPIRWYEILCCYRMSRPGLLSGQRLRELVRVDREDLVAICKLEAIFIFSNGMLHGEAYWKFTPTLFCLSYRREKHALVKAA